jgi:hypothetical protein
MSPAQQCAWAMLEPELPQTDVTSLLPLILRLPSGCSVLMEVYDKLKVIDHSEG